MSEPGRRTQGMPLVLLAVLVAGAAGLFGPGCLERRDDEPAAAGDEGRCATCHGDPARVGDFLRRAAPPRGLAGAAAPEDPRVGAHDLHLDPSSTHGGVACVECHRVPETVHSEGHIGSPGAAEVIFGSQARDGGRSPRYHPETRTCSDTSCHGDTEPVWNEPRSPDGTCGSCHALPPPAPHPASDQCSTCHGDVIDAERRFIAPRLHVNGVVDVSYPPGSCGGCHGSGDDPAPPPDTRGEVVATAPGVGAHQAHLTGGISGRPVACTECHAVPATVDAEGHVDGERAQVVLTGVATTGAHASAAFSPATGACADTHCHGPSPGSSGQSPPWTEPGPLPCTGCHGAPPPAPHPASGECSVCHGQVVDSSLRIIDRALHVDGAVAVDYPPESCALCHGSGDDPAPPRDTLGNTDRGARGVGAHQVHLGGGASGRPLACEECHTVPATVNAPGHVNGLPAEVVLTGVARAGSRDAAHYDVTAGRCADTWCHGPGGATERRSPPWTEPGALGCTGCHGAPPAAPHPQMSDCSLCHPGVAADDVSFVDRSRHIDGRVDVASPPGECTACHGGVDGPAPPRDVSGGSSPSATGVGAHAAHVNGSPRARAVACTSCHRVPSTLLDEGHVDTPLPAEVTFQGAAAIWGGSPRYEAGTCRDTSCHGGRFPDGHASGGTHTEPSWTEGAAGAPCGSCHGLPPPPPHPYGNLNPVCSACHENIADDNLTFLRPDLHVDGRVTFTVP